MPIYEYECEDCRTKFEKLVRTSSETSDLVCPSCGQKHLRLQFSTFAPQMGANRSDVPMCPSGGVCPTPGACGRN